MSSFFSLSLSLIRIEPPLGISLTSRSTVQFSSSETALPIPPGIATSRRIANERERTNKRTDGRQLLSLFRAERASAVPRERHGTVRYGTRRPGDRRTGSPFFRLRKEKPRDWGTRAWATTRRENCQPFGSRASLAGRISVYDCVVTTVTPEMCAGVWRTFSHHDELRSGEQVLTTVPPFVVTEVLPSALLRRGYPGTNRCASKPDAEFKMAPGFEEKTSKARISFSEAKKSRFFSIILGRFWFDGFLIRILSNI